MYGFFGQLEMIRKDTQLTDWQLQKKKGRNLIGIEEYIFM